MKVTLLYPSKLVFGIHSFATFVDDVIAIGYHRIFLLVAEEVLPQLNPGINRIKLSGCNVKLNTSIKKEPSLDDYQKILDDASGFKAECIVGIGGGSVMDTAKLAAAMVGSGQNINDIVAGKQKISRSVKLICLPTTAGTGSEVSPNAIFFNPETGEKFGVIDPQLVPDAAYVDPELTVGVPQAVTASTGIDALTHCIEAYVNKFSNPVNDLLALEGIKLIGRNLKRAYDDGNDLEAREKVALGSMYGGMCLGPVNTGAVHALAYPIGSSFKIAHGISNALMLPCVMEFNLDHAVGKYAQIARALGVEEMKDDWKAAREGIKLIGELIAGFNLPRRLKEIGIEEKHIVEMAASALKIQRLLKNNVREVQLQDAINIYRKAL